MLSVWEQRKNAKVERREREWEGEWESCSIGLPARATREERRERSGEKGRGGRGLRSRGRQDPNRSPARMLRRGFGERGDAKGGDGGGGRGFYQR